MRARVTFKDNRIGHHYDIEPLTFTYVDGPDLSRQIWDIARRNTIHTDVRVSLDLESGLGFIIDGYADAGQFTIEEEHDEDR